MAIGVTDEKHYKAIADVIRSYTDSSDTFTPSEMPDGIVRAVDKEANAARQEGYDSGHEAGQKSGYDAFWDMFQDNGNRNNYQDAFKRWTATEIKPKYVIKTDRLYGMFSDCYNLERLPQIELLPITGATYTAFTNCRKLKSVDIDVLMYASCGNVFLNCYELETIKKIIIDKTVTSLAGAFNFLYALKNITFEGEIPLSMNFQWSTKLTKESIISIINALSSSTSGLSITLSQVAVDNAFTDAEWEALIATKTNWTISLV